MRHLPPLPAVRVFEAAARHENFTQAATELGMSQAAVSYQIRLLEERLGVPLFIRSKRRVTLSDAGRKVASDVSEAFDTISQAFSSLVDEDESVLAISAAQTFATAWLAPRLGRFQISRPELAVRILTSNQLVDFASDEVDVAVRMGRGPWPGLRQDFLFCLHGTPLCTAEFRDRHRIERPEDLLRVPRLNAEDVWWKQWFEAAGVDPPQSGPPGIRLDAQALEGSATLAGHGVGLLTPLYWRTELREERLVQPFPLTVVTGPTLWLVYPEHKRGRAKIRAFREWLLAAMEKEAAAGPAEAFIPPEA
jgi:LysR family glycine cleavage system transcriptional activator